MAYASWNDYETLYLLGREPVIPQQVFPYWAEMAADKIDRFTFNRIDSAVLEQYNRKIVRAVCALAEFYYTPEELNEFRGFRSVSVTGHSVSLDDRTQGDKEKEAAVIIRTHLGDTGLLYRGV